MGRVISPAPGTLKSIQRGVITISSSVPVTAALSPAVDTTKTKLRYLGCTSDNSAFSLAAHVVLTNSTTVTATRTSATGTTVVSWETEEVY
jgi:hypothetical protein